MATKTKPKPKSTKGAKANKPKLRGGNSDNPADEPLIPVDSSHESTEAQKDADLSTAPRPTREEWMNANPGQEPPTDLQPAPGTLAEKFEELRQAAGPGLEGDSGIREILDASKAYDSPDVLAEYDAATFTETRERLQRRAELWAREEISKAAHKADKAAAEEYDTDYFAWINERTANRGRPPQPKPAKLYPDPDNPGVQVDAPDLPLAPAEDDDRWKAIPLTELVEKDGFPAYLVEKLANATRKDDRPQAPITTLGELTQFQEPNAAGWQNKLTDLQGVGPGAAEKIANACMAFWDRWAREEAARRLAAKSEAPGEPVDAEFEVIPDEGEDDDEVDEPEDDEDVEGDDE